MAPRSELISNTLLLGFCMNDGKDVENICLFFAKSTKVYYDIRS